MKKIKKEEKVDVKIYNQYLIVNEFNKIIKERLFFELDEGLYVFIKMIMSYEIIKDFSDYGEGLIDLDFTHYFTGDKCLLCYIKFDMDEFLDCMVEMYEDELYD
jgi:hypothetical protein